MTDEATEDERDIELSSITAIFPELSIDPQDSHTASLELQIAPSTPITVVFEPAPDDAELPIPFTPFTQAQVQRHLSTRPPDLHTLHYLPPLHLKINLPDKYPDHQSPYFHLSTTPDWLPPSVLARLNEEGRNLWEEYGHSQVVYAYIDFVQQEAERGFGLADGLGWELPHALKAPLLTHDRRTKKQKFDQETFDCGVCLDPKKGSACYRLRRCGHVFCIGCLQDFYNSAITEGDIASVKCLAPDCGMENMNVEQRRKKKQRSLHPSELLDIPLEEPQVRRYVNLKLKKKLESDRSTVYCPRTWCQGPAKSAKYAKYDNRNLHEYPESDSETEDDAPPLAMPNTNVATNTNRAPPPDRLSICSTCAFAFCRLCQRSWHGEHINCLPRSTAELTAEEKASYDYIRLHTSPCPTCSSPCQKTHGCNHMRCFQCRSHFCYLCSSWLHPDDPYRHFNEKGKDCYMRLWELEEGDEGPGNGEPVPFLGARAAEAAHLAAAEAMQEEDMAAAEAEGAQDEQDDNMIEFMNGMPARWDEHGEALPRAQDMDVLMEQIQQEMQALRAQVGAQRRVQLVEIDQVLDVLRDARLRRRQIVAQGPPEAVAAADRQLRDLDGRLRVQEVALLRRMRALRAA